MATLWRHRDFQKLWVGQTISEIGSRITRDGIPMTAVMVLGASPLQMGLLVFLNGIASLTAGLSAGHTADRHRRRPILIWADIGRAAVLLTVPLAAAFRVLSMGQLYAVVFVTGVLTIFFDVAYQSFLPSLVKQEQLLEGNSKLAISAASAEVIGPGLTGVLVQTLTAPRAILLDSLSFLVSAVSISMIRTPEPAPRGHHDDETTRDIAAGAKYVAANAILRALFLRAATYAFFMGFFSTLYVLWAIRELKLSPVLFGIVVALGGVGNLTGALFSEHLSKKLHFGRILIGATLLVGLVTFLIPAAHGPVWMAAVFLGAAQLFGDIAFPIYSVHELTLRQRLAPPALLGRVNAVMQLAFKGLLPCGALAGGAIAGAIGMRYTLLLCAVGVTASSLFLILSPLRTLRTLPEAVGAVAERQSAG